LRHARYSLVLKDDVAIPSGSIFLSEHVVWGIGRARCHGSDAIITATLGIRCVFAAVYIQVQKVE
jgi:hypothetical protein